MVTLMWIVAGILVLSSILMCVVVLVQQTKSSGNNFIDILDILAKIQLLHLVYPVEF